MKSLFAILTQIVLANWVHAISCGDSASTSFFLQSPSEYIWNGFLNDSTPWHRLSTQCKRHLQLVSSAINSGQVWPFRFLDASGKLPSGLLDGTITSLGDYDECLAITSHVRNEFIHGAYCLVRFTKSDIIQEKQSPLEHELAEVLSLYNTFTLNIGMCLPSSCTENDIRSLLESISPLAKVSKDEIYCDSTESNNKRLFSMTFSQLLSW